jgi:hypothetical protein
MKKILFALVAMVLVSVSSCTFGTSTSDENMQDTTANDTTLVVNDSTAADSAVTVDAVK